MHHGTFHEAFLRLAFSSVECTGNYVVNMVSNPRINLSKPDKDALLGDFSWHQRSLTFHIWVKINFFFDREHLLKRDDLSAHLEVNKCLNISPLFQTSFALLFDHYIEWISKIADCKKILYRCHTFLIKLCWMLSKWHLRCAARLSLFQWLLYLLR